MQRRLLPLTLACTLLAATGSGWAQSVALAGLLGSKALMVVNGSQPRSLAVGETYQGVKLVSLQDNRAEVDVGGVRQTLRLGGAPASVGNTASNVNGSKIVLSADSRGHFVTQGQINGQATTMMIDTGASYVSLSAAQARQIGLNYRNGTVGALSTANGVVQSWRVKLDTLRVGEVTLYGIEALVSDGAMPYVLLGNNFLGRFQMNRNNDQMVLDRRY